MLYHKLIFLGVNLVIQYIPESNAVSLFEWPALDIFDAKPSNNHNLQKVQENAFTVQRKVFKRNIIHPITMKKYIAYYEDKREPYRHTPSLMHGKHWPELSHIVSLEVGSGIPDVENKEYSGISLTEQETNADSPKIMNLPWTSLDLAKSVWVEEDDWAMINYAEGFADSDQEVEETERSLYGHWDLSLGLMTPIVR